ncbi:hypothetical protein VTN77DRAFT_1575 [Rasamsonia byssochlamydoides]|uniref:uncharacterized protein n=1 Tax=Rasamsonia byssochlamydoides TaxID=89139 RepID=UPI003743B738
MAFSLLYFCAAISACLLSTASAALTITIPPSNLLPNPHVLPPTTHATLTTLPSSSQKKHVFTAPLTRSSTFVFPDLQQQQQQRESYLLDIRSKEYVFAPYRVDVAADGTILGIWETFRGNPWDNRGAEKFVAPAGRSSSSGQNQDVIVEAKVVARRGFYEERPRFSPLSLFKNPMILLAVFAMAVTFGMPKLLENMDPEIRAEFEKQSRSGPLSGASRSALAAGTGAGGPGGAAAGGFDLAGWMAGATSSPVSAPDTATGVTTGRESGSAGRRRG